MDLARLFPIGGDHQSRRMHTYDVLFEVAPRTLFFKSSLPHTHKFKYEPEYCILRINKHHYHQPGYCIIQLRGNTLSWVARANLLS